MRTENMGLLNDKLTAGIGERLSSELKGDVWSARQGLLLLLASFSSIIFIITIKHAAY